MINKLSIIFSLFFCLAVFGGAAVQLPAQTGGGDKILVTSGRQQLRQSDVDSVIEFYEWAFQARFTGDERERFQAIMVAAFRQDAAESRKGADALIEVLAKVRARDEAAQQKVRVAFSEDFIKELRVSNDASAQLLLGVYERGQTGETTANLMDAPAKSTGGAGAKSLVGRWMRSTGLGRGDDGTGKTTYSSGENHTFEFFADGTMQFTSDKKVLSITQCRISETAKIPGTYTVAGDRLIINLGAGSSVGTSSCEAKGNFKKTLTASTLEKTFVVRKMESVFRPDAPLLLCFDDAARDEDCFERDPKN
jgi:predicted enzyme related to lactoylglutathione lyase